MQNKMQLQLQLQLQKGAKGAKEAQENDIRSYVVTSMTPSAGRQVVRCRKD